MTNRTGMYGATAKALGRLLPWFGILLLGVVIAFASRQSAPMPSGKRDLAFIKAVKASISPRDVQTILAHQRSSAAVHLKLSTACILDLHCTIFVSMEFPGSGVHAPGLSLQVAVHVVPTAGTARPKTMSSWEVSTIDSPHGGRVHFAGDFNDLSKVPSIGEHNAIASLLMSIRSAITHVLMADGVIAGTRTTGTSTIQLDPMVTRARPDEN